MKKHLFIAGAVVTYVTMAFVVMHKWARTIEKELNNKKALKEAFELGRSVEQMRNGDLVDL